MQFQSLAALLMLCINLGASHTERMEPLNMLGEQDVFQDLVVENACLFCFLAGDVNFFFCQDVLA